MSKLAWLVPGLFALVACSDSSSDPDSASISSGMGTPAANGGVPSTVEAPNQTEMAAPSSGAPAPVALPPVAGNPAWVAFVDPDNGLSTQDVRDADREIVHFDLQSQAMIWAASGDAVAGWVTEGNDLHWERTGGSFRVRFGSEAGEHRAYFTEAGPGTICNLSITAPGQLSISATSQTPPRS
jgi:hypothetical protein